MAAELLARVGELHKRGVSLTAPAALEPEEDLYHTGRGGRGGHRWGPGCGGGRGGGQPAWWLEGSALAGLLAAGRLSGLQGQAAALPCVACPPFLPAPL